MRFFHSTQTRLLLLLLLCPLLLTHAASASTTGSTKNVRHLVKNGGYLVAEHSGLSYHADKQFTPASTLKIFTTLVALERLGADYRFTTLVYLDKQQNLYIKGGGDPFLTSERVAELCRRLHIAHPELQQVNTLFLDDSRYNLKGRQISIENSRNPYDAPNGALAVNFNALPIRVGKHGKVTSGEKQTPTLPIMAERAKALHLGRGFHRINIGYQAEEPRSFKRLTPTLRYAGQLFGIELAAHGISVKRGFARKKTPAKLSPILIYKSHHTLEQMVRKVLKYSNNFVANQLFLQLSLERNRHLGRPATWEDSRRIVTTYARKKLGLIPAEFHVEEGSGLSMENRITCAAFIKILKRFTRWAKLLPTKGGALVKSGTMPHAGVFCYAGYFPRKGRLIPFALLLNQHANNRVSLLQALRKRVR